MTKPDKTSDETSDGTRDGTSDGISDFRTLISLGHLSILPFLHTSQIISYNFGQKFQKNGQCVVCRSSSKVFYLTENMNCSVSFMHTSNWMKILANLISFKENLNEPLK